MRLLRPARGRPARRAFPFKTVALLALAAAPAGQSAAQAQAAPDKAALEALYWARIDESRSSFTPADVTYMTGMIGHHAQALVMSAMAPTHSAGPELLRLAARIDNAQRDEIASMQKWLRDRDQPVPKVPEMGDHSMAGMDHDGMDHDAMTEMDHGDMDGMDHGDKAEMDHDRMDHDSMDHDGADHEDADHEGMNHEGMNHAMMPGMLSAAQLAQLDAARGTEFDRLFLRFMIQHHGGAVSMVETLFATDGAAQDGESFKLATDVQVDQRTEIARMQLMLDRLEAPTTSGR